jgi:septal ring factor EnvC (AmiA/AmiB activator)
LAFLISGKPLISITVQSNTEFNYQKENLPENGKKAELEFVLNPVFMFTPTQPKPAKDTTGSRRKILQYELSKEISRQAQQRSERQLVQNRIKSLTETIPGLDLYEREKATQELKKLNSELASFPDIQDNAQKIRIQIDEINVKTLPIDNEPIKLSGYINHLKL